MDKYLQAESKSVTKPKIGKLVLGIVFDIIGMLSYLVPVFAEVTDIIWAPIAGFILSVMYKGSLGKIGGIVAFVEEIIPGLDIIPTFTLTWIYEYYTSKKSKI